MFSYGDVDMYIEQINRGGTVSYMRYDQVGSTRLITGSTGTVTGKCTYSAYGTPTCEAATTTPLGSDGQCTSPDTGLIYMRARTYDPATAQFLSSDPLTAITWEPYSYVGDNPVNRADRTGLCDAEPWTGGFWTEGNCVSGAVGGPNGGGSQPAWWDVPAYGAVLIPCVAGAEALCAGGVAESGAAQARGKGSGSAEGFLGCGLAGTVGDESGVPPNWEPLSP